MVVSLALLLLPATSVLAADQGVTLTGYVDGVFQAVQGANPVSAEDRDFLEHLLRRREPGGARAKGQPSENVAFDAERTPADQQPGRAAHRPD